VRAALGSRPVALTACVVLASVGRVLDELSAGKRILLARRIAVPSENLPAAHVVVAVTATMGILLQGGVMLLVHRTPPELSESFTRTL
jgi:hypothetical protein